MTKFTFPTASGYNVIVEADTQEKANEIFGKIFNKTEEQSPLVKTANSTAD